MRSTTVEELLKSSGPLPRPFGRPHPADLALDRGQKRLAPAQLRLDRRPLGRPRRHHLLLLGPRAREPLPAEQNFAAEGPDLANDRGVLGGDAVDRLDPAEQVVEASGAEQDLEAGNPRTACLAAWFSIDFNEMKVPMMNAQDFLVLDLEGRLRIDTEPGAGTRVIVELPVQAGTGEAG